MNLRWDHGSLRLRMDRAELNRLEGAGRLTGSVGLGPSRPVLLAYSIHVDPEARQAHAETGPGRLRIRLPGAAVDGLRDGTGNAVEISLPENRGGFRVHLEVDTGVPCPARARGVPCPLGGTVAPRNRKTGRDPVLVPDRGPGEGSVSPPRRRT